MGKKIIVNERVLKHILMEMTKESKLINEAISVANAYAKFYSTKLTEEEYDAAVKGTTNMTPFHKALLDCMISAKESQSWDWMLLGRECGEIWANADANIRQLLLKAVKSKELNPQNPNDFYEKTIEISQTKAATKAQVANNGLVTLYEDDNILITCTTTYSASQKFYGDSHWCTASDIYGQYNGYCMFIGYTVKDDACLIQMVPKSNRERMFQAQAYKDRFGQICDFEDNTAGENTMLSTMAVYQPKIQGIVDKLLTSEKVNELIQKTKVESEEDSKYWVPKTEERIAQLAEKIKEKSKFDVSPTVSSMLGQSIMYKNNIDSKYDDDINVSVAIFCSGSLDAPYFLLKCEIDCDEILGGNDSSWLWSCRKVFKSASQASVKLFLCKTIKFDRSTITALYGTVKEIDDYDSGVFSVNGVLGYSTNYSDDGNVYNIISRKTGEVILSGECVEYFTSDYLILGRAKGPFKVFDVKKNKVVLSDIDRYRLSWGELYIHADYTSGKPHSTSDGFMRLQDAARYFR